MRRGVWVRVAAVLALAAASPAAAQNLVSVPFTNGFVGTRGSSAGTGNAVLTFATLGISRAFFIQSSSTNSFELQGNDIPGTLRLVRTNGTTLDVPASANWRNSGGSTYLIGILPRPAAPITFSYGGGSIQITDGTVNGGTSVGGYVAAYVGTTLADGESTSGNAAQSQVLSGLNSYLTTVVASRPAGPVTVTAQSTTSATPTIAGTATLGAGEALSVVVGGVQYTTSSTPALQAAGGAWSLALATPLAVGVHSVTATVTNADGFTLSDGTTGELTITAPTTAVTVGGSFVASGKVYDATVAAAGTTGSLTLAGVQGGHQVTIAAATFAFADAAAGAGKTVAITSVTLGGTDAALYTVNLAGAPTAAATIATRPLTITGVAAVSRAYDGTTAATLSGTAAYAGLPAGQSFAVAGTPTAGFATAEVGPGKAVTVAGYLAPSANYTVSQPTGLTAAITAKPLTVGGTFTAADRPYDGSTTATITVNTLAPVGVVGAESVSLAGLAASFATAAVGAGKTVSLAAASLAGPDAANYTLSLLGAPTTTASITAVAPAGGTLTIGGALAAHDKVYDATTAATGSAAGLALVGVQGGHQVSIAGVTLAFQGAAVGAARTVTLTGVTLGGADAALYAVSLAGAPTTTAAITPRPLTVGGSFGAADKVHDGSAAATIVANALTLVGTAGGDALALTGLAAAVADAAVGAGKRVALTAAPLPAAAAANYALSLAGAPTAAASITAAGGGAPPPPPPPPPQGGVLTVGGAFTAHDKLFDGLAIATGATGGLTLAGVAPGHQVSIAAVSLAFPSAAVGTGRTVSITGVTLAGAQAPLYTVSLVGAPTAVAAIAPRPLTIGGSFAAADKPHDGTAAATMTANALRLLGAMGGHDVALAGVTVAFADAAVGAGKRVAIAEAPSAAAMAGSYVLSLAGAPTATASILAATRPSAPRAAAAARGDGSLKIAWAPPADAGCRAVTGYVVEVTADEARGWTRVAAAASPVTVPGLVNQLAYRVRVAAVNPCARGAGAGGAPAAPQGPAREADGRPTPAAPGAVGVTTAGAPRPATTTVVEDTIVRVAAPDFTLRVRALDAAGAAIPVDPTHALALEQAGRAAAEGSGFAPGSRVTLYLVAADRAARLLGAVAVRADGTFAGDAAVPAALPEGDYTLQVNGVDVESRPRTIALGVEVAAPPPELDLTATADRPAPALGDTVVITLVVANTGRGAATDVEIPRAFREPGFAVLRATPLDGAYRADTQTWTIPRIAPGARARLLLTAVVVPPDAVPSPTTPPTPLP
ncbi:YDG domain-containing protein [Roseisolibacter sp. H3M3-2]|uniref:YDG domain-containing protein n=1 Tax=Roseisolibacter sp. H3M3-2 TaxID=3031323 RepID=UPI0023DBCB81|nr:YDG domain-containing protein [Roseisolibacter sp. H3M3-2]MDF1505191.1 YDG domain-containing protein [Roseisolibacter sp. H3M3-2]